MVTAWDHGQLVEIDRHRKRKATDRKHGKAEDEVGVDIKEAVGLNGPRRFFASALFRLTCPASLDIELLRTASIHSLQDTNVIFIPSSQWQLIRTPALQPPPSTRVPAFTSLQTTPAYLPNGSTPTPPSSAQTHPKYPSLNPVFVRSHI